MAWARAVKARQRAAGIAALPPLWLFTDRLRQPDPLGAIKRLPPGLAGVVLRQDAPARRQIAAICRQRRLKLTIAAGPQQPGAGQHLHGGRRRTGPHPTFLTSSAHTAAELRRAARAGADVIFLSPLFHTSSHPDAQPLGVHRWCGLSRHSPRIAALGGIDAQSLRAVPRWCRHIGAIAAFTRTGRS